MNKSLNISVFKDALIRAGMNQSDLADKLNVSREAVSKWVQGGAFPQPDKLLRIGMLLKLSFEQLVTVASPTLVPIVTFRRKARTKTRDEHLDSARETGELLKQLVKYLPGQDLTQPPTLKNPINSYDYIQRVAADVRKEMGLMGKERIDFKDIIAKFDRLHAVIIPVLWGAREYHGNALNIHLPDSKTTWIFLNLDSNTVDFKFWMAHELGHSFAPTLSGEAGEDFADSFAQALLFPESHADKLHNVLQRIPGIGARIERVRSEAIKHVISPYTIRLALEGYEQARGIPKTKLGDLSPFMGSVVNFGKRYPTISKTLFRRLPPKPADYIDVARSVFESQFFDALSEFCKNEQGAEHFIHRVLGVSLADAKALSVELRK
ncbi:MAG: helix-turn-helix transcriptional regulator [Candidatus Aureabacteria bacterium]|nr:helix-turn-helix transcriptional regulator [Candidatus Auribacterota bacterium]